MIEEEGGRRRAYEIRVGADTDDGTDLSLERLRFRSERLSNRNQRQSPSPYCCVEPEKEKMLTSTSFVSVIKIDV